MKNNDMPIEVLQEEWNKFKGWCGKNNFNLKIPYEYGFINTKNGEIVLLIDFGKVMLLKKNPVVDTEFELVVNGEVNK